MNINQKIEKVKEILNNKKIALAFSGGADSTLIAHLAKEAGADVLGITYDNKILPSEFLLFAKRRAEEIGIKHEIVEGNFLDIDEFVHNSPKRCLLCRKLMYGAIKEKAQKEGYEIIVDGNNITDLTHDRPGILMKYEYNIESPFIEAELETYEIHDYIERNNIEYSKSTTCLATRIQTNEKLTIEKINRLDYCEDYIKTITGSDIVKLREANNVATIEIDNLENILDKGKIDLIVKDLKAAQYDKVLLNIGLETGIDYLVKDENMDIGEENYTFRRSLPFGININASSREFEKFIEENKEEAIISNLETLEEIGYLKFMIYGKKAKVFRDGKIVIENNKDKLEAKEAFVKILPLIRRIA